MHTSHTTTLTDAFADLSARVARIQTPTVTLDRTLVSALRTCISLRRLEADRPIDFGMTAMYAAPKSTETHAGARQKREYQPRGARQIAYAKRSAVVSR